MIDDITASNSPRGYQRSDALQTNFDKAAKRLLKPDGPRTTMRPPRLVADLALEGGGVKGLGLVGAVVVLDEAGYSFRGVAGTSAGAIAAVLVAGLAKAGRPMTDLYHLIGSLNFKNFMPSDRLREYLQVLGEKRGDLVADLATLVHRDGIYSGNYLAEWLRPILHDQLGVKTFADLRLDAGSDPGMSLKADRHYSVVVHTSDISRGQLVRLPWDYPFYDLEPDAQDPVDAVRASMSIPFFFEPVQVPSKEVDLELPRAGGGVTKVHYAAGTQNVGRRRALGELSDPRIRPGRRGRSAMADDRHQVGELSKRTFPPWRRASRASPWRAAARRRSPGSGTRTRSTRRRRQGPSSWTTWASRPPTSTSVRPSRPNCS